MDTLDDAEAAEQVIEEDDLKSKESRQGHYNLPTNYPSPIPPGYVTGTT